MAAKPGTDDAAELESRLLKAALEDPLLSTPTHASSRLFALISVLLASPSSPRARLVRQTQCCYSFHVTNDAGREETWWVDLKKTGRVGRGKAPMKPGVSVWIADGDLIGLATGKLQPQKLFAAKRIRVRGNLDKALGVAEILTHEREKLEGVAPAPEPPATREKGGRWMAMKGKIKARL